MLFWALVQGLKISVQVSTEKQSSAEWGKGTGQSLMDSFQEGHVRKSLLWAMKGEGGQERGTNFKSCWLRDWLITPCQLKQNPTQMHLC